MGNVVITGKTPGPCGCCNPAPVCPTWFPLIGLLEPYLEISCVGAYTDYGPSEPPLIATATSDGSLFTFSGSRGSSHASSFNAACAINVKAGKKIIIDGSTGGGSIINNEVRIYNEGEGEVASYFVTTPGFHHEYTALVDGLYQILSRQTAFEPPFGPNPVSGNFSVTSNGPCFIYCLYNSHDCAWCVCPGLP